MSTIDINSDLYKEYISKLKQFNKCMTPFINEYEDRIVSKSLYFHTQPHDFCVEERRILTETVSQIKEKYSL